MQHHAPMNIRKEKDVDIEKIWNVNAQAFKTEVEANLVNVLRDSGVPYISITQHSKTFHNPFG